MGAWLLWVTSIGLRPSPGCPVPDRILAGRVCPIPHVLRPLSRTGPLSSSGPPLGPGPSLPTLFGHSPASPTLAHLGPSLRSPWCPTPSSPGSGPEPPTPPRPAAPSRRLQFLPTRASRAHRASGPFSSGRRAPSAPAPSPSSLSDLGLSPHQPSCLSSGSRLPPPPFILPGPGSWPRQPSPVPQQPRRAPPLSPSPPPPCRFLSPSRYQLRASYS